MGRISERTSEIRSKLNGGFGKAGVKGRDKRKERALDTGLTKQKLLHALSKANGPKRSLGKADAVIHGATNLRISSYSRPPPTWRPKLTHNNLCKPLAAEVGLAFEAVERFADNDLNGRYFIVGQLFKFAFAPLAAEFAFV